MNRAKQSTVELATSTWSQKIALLWWILIASFYVPGAIARTVTYFYVDHQGTVLATADANGVVTSSTDYRPYGVLALGGGSESLGYTGHVKDDDVGLIYMQARYYDPQIARFVSVDPAIYTPGTVSMMGRFAYATDNPYRYIDPTGRRSCSGSLDRSECMSDGWLVPEERTFYQRVSLSQGDDGSNHRPGCDTAECDEVKTTRANILRQQGEALEEAGAFGAREGAMMLAGGAIGKVLGRLAGAFGLAERVAITFGRNENAASHAFRHIEGVGLSRSAVRDVVLADLKSASRNVVPGKPYNGIVEVEGMELTYTAYRLPDGSINVGRITTPGAAK
ncbi:RHS repeat-associated core domain-containing protein [Luteibacter sp. SG786]|uniref:RHS repeat-associated core domain-containing protein n=1 Tax=Luteibacter sp. SG786 TaxID=2587130 RepID=UPI0014208458|nr:RHS repeat-associated core domain-containing protein [Luteibacter sp. SG786]NII52783.1 RHS repeat-associated protein [Luteibacter sp. SG786]